MKKSICVVGAGLAGSECAYQLAQLGHQVHLYEMRPKTMTPAHKTSLFGELVCSNSLGSLTDYSAPGQLKWEARKHGSIVLEAAELARVPAGMALGVDRTIFAQHITDKVRSHPNIKVIEETVLSIDEIPRPAVIATGPLTHDSLSQSLKDHFDGDFLYFYDAIAPIIDSESIDYDITWKADRWGKGTNDYINCPLNKEQYFNLIEEIKAARKVEPKDFEKDVKYFEGCMPVEAVVERGDRTLRFGAMSPKGLPNPKTDKDEYAIVQLRQENKQATAYNMVGFQTKMAYGEQKRIFRMIPGLEDADFLKLGSIHRNLYIHTPKKLTAHLSSQKDPGLFFAGQITGVEGYFDSTCIGLLVANFVHQYVNNLDIQLPNRYTAFGSLLNGITEDKKHFQPTNINFSLFPKVEGDGMRGRKGREKRRDLQIKNAQENFSTFH